MHLNILTFSFAFFILAFQKDPNTLCAQGPLQGLKRLYRKNSLIFLHFFFFLSIPFPSNLKTHRNRPEPNETNYYKIVIPTWLLTLCINLYKHIIPKIAFVASTRSI